MNLDWNVRMLCEWLRKCLEFSESSAELLLTARKTWTQQRTSYRAFDNRRTRHSSSADRTTWSASSAVYDTLRRRHRRRRWTRRASSRRASTSPTLTVGTDRKMTVTVTLTRRTSKRRAGVEDRHYRKRLDNYWKKLRTKRLIDCDESLYCIALGWSSSPPPAPERYGLYRTLTHGFRRSLPGRNLGSLAGISSDDVEWERLLAFWLLWWRRISLRRHLTAGDSFVWKTGGDVADRISRKSRLRKKSNKDSSSTVGYFPFSPSNMKLSTCKICEWVCALTSCICFSVGWKTLNSYAAAISNKMWPKQMVSMASLQSFRCFLSIG